MKNKIFKVFILTIILIILLTNISIAVPGKVNDSNVRVRSGPSTEGTETLTNLYLNDSVDVIEKTGDWYKIKTKSGIVGYMYADFINVSGNVPGATVTEKPKPELEPKPTTKPQEKPEEKPTPEETEEVLQKVKIKKELKTKYMPFMFSGVKENIKKGSEINIIDQKANWSKILFKGQEGWVLTKDIN